jgi:hypothetical protein
VAKGVISLMSLATFLSVEARVILIAGCRKNRILFGVSQSKEIAHVNSDIKPPLLVVDPERFYRFGKK